MGNCLQRMGVHEMNCISEMRKLDKRITELTNELKQVRSSIRTHRDNIWGDQPVEHPEDIELYDSTIGNK